MTVQLEFVGHACFRLWEDGRPTIVMDPFSHEKTELVDDGFRLKTETVIVSSLTDPAHDHVELASGSPHVINALDVATGRIQETINGEPLIAIPAAEIPDHPEGTDDNALYAFKAGGLWFGHLGDLGFGLSNEDLAPWKGRCDVLLAIVGEKYTVPLDALDSMIEFLQPTWIVPMHYAMPPLGGEGVPGAGMSPVDVFLNRRRRDPVIIPRHHTITFPTIKSEDGRPTIVVPEPSGYPFTGGLPEFRVPEFQTVQN